MERIVSKLIKHAELTPEQKAKMEQWKQRGRDMEAIHSPEMYYKRPENSPFGRLDMQEIMEPQFMGNEWGQYDGPRRTPTPEQQAEWDAREDFHKSKFQEEGMLPVGTKVQYQNGSDAYIAYIVEEGKVNPGSNQPIYYLAKDPQGKHMLWPAHQSDLIVLERPGQEKTSGSYFNIFKSAQSEPPSKFGYESVGQNSNNYEEAKNSIMDSFFDDPEFGDTPQNIFDFHSRKYGIDVLKKLLQDPEIIEYKLDKPLRSYLGSSI